MQRRAPGGLHRLWRYGVTIHVMVERETSLDGCAATGPRSAESFAISAARIAAESRSENISVLDLRGLSGISDFFVLGTGTSDRQMQSVLERIKQYAKTLDLRPFRAVDTRSATWILADYVDVVIHLFDAEHRGYYDLDGLWGDAPRIAWQPEGDDAAR